MKTRKAALSLPLVVLTLLLAPSCGGGGGGGGDAVLGPVNAVAPSAEITHPPDRSATEEGRIAVTGTADPGTGTIASVRVNGAVATTTDDYATWSASVFVKFGVNTIEVAVEDGDGTVHTSPASIQIAQTTPFLVRPSGVALDPALGRALIVDSMRGELLAMDLSTGERKILSGRDVGAGPLMDFPNDVVLDAANNRVLVTDAGLNVLFEISLLDGDRRIVGATGSATGVSYVPGEDRVLLTHAFEGLFSLELSTGKLIPISKDDPAQGATTLLNARNVARDPDGKTAYVTVNSKVVKVDLTNGDRRILSDASNGSGPTLVFAFDVQFNSKYGLVVADQSRGLVTVDPKTGDRVVVTGGGVGSGDPLRSLVDVDIEDGSDTAYIMDSFGDVLVSVDMTSGARVALGRISLGSGDALDSVNALELDGQGRVLAADSRFTTGGRLVAVDPRSGDRELVSGPGRGTGTDFAGVRDVAAHPVTGQILVVDSSDRLFGVDPVSGDRNVILDDTATDGERIDRVLWHPSGAAAILLTGFGDELRIADLVAGTTTVLSPTTATPVSFFGVEDIALDPERNRVLATRSSRVLAVDLATGNRSVVTDANDSVGSGVPFGDAASLTVDSERAIAYVHDPDAGILFSVDLGTGARELVSESSAGGGLALDGFSSPGMTLTKDGTGVLFFHSETASILSIGVESGERMVIAK